MRMLCPASCLPLAERLTLLQATYGDRELLEAIKTLLGFGVEVASGQRQMIKCPAPCTKSPAWTLLAMQAEITVEAQGGYCSDRHQHYYPQVPLLRDQLFAALKGKEEHTLFKQPGKVPWAC